MKDGTVVLLSGGLNDRVAKGRVNDGAVVLLSGRELNDRVVVLLSGGGERIVDHGMGWLGSWIVALGGSWIVDRGSEV